MDRNEWKVFSSACILITVEMDPGPTRKSDPKPLFHGRIIDSQILRRGGEGRKVIKHDVTAIISLKNKTVD